MKPALRLAAVALLAALAGAGCASVTSREPLTVSLANVVPTEASLFETAAALTLRLTNESPRAVTLAGGVHRLYLNGTYVGRAVTNERVTLPELSTVTQTLTVHLENLALVRKLTELSQTQAPTISYRLDSRLHAADGGAWGGFRTSTTGELDLSGLRAAAEGPMPRTSAPSASR